MMPRERRFPSSLHNSFFLFLSLLDSIFVSCMCVCWFNRWPFYENRVLSCDENPQDDGRGSCNGVACRLNPSALRMPAIRINLYSRIVLLLFFFLRYKTFCVSLLSYFGATRLTYRIISKCILVREGIKWWRGTSIGQRVFWVPCERAFLPVRWIRERWENIGGAFGFPWFLTTCNPPMYRLGACFSKSDRPIRSKLPSLSSHLLRTPT